MANAVNTIWVEGHGTVVDGPVLELASQHARTGKWDGRIDCLSRKDASLFWKVLAQLDRQQVLCRAS